MGKRCSVDMQVEERICRLPQLQMQRGVSGERRCRAQAALPNRRLRLK